MTHNKFKGQGLKEEEKYQDDRKKTTKMSSLGPGVQPLALTPVDPRGHARGEFPWRRKQGGVHQAEVSDIIYKTQVISGMKTFTMETRRARARWNEFFIIVVSPRYWGSKSFLLLAVFCRRTTELHDPFGREFALGCTS